jgi:hypothetical protein
MAKASARPKGEAGTTRPTRARAPKHAGNGEVHVPASPDQEAIRLRAYQLYLERGAIDGADFDDWVTAERELTGAQLTG